MGTFRRIGYGCVERLRSPLGVVTPLFVELLLYLVFNSLDNALAVLQKLQHDYGRLLGMAINLAIVEYALGRGKRSLASGPGGLIGAKIQ